MDLEVKVMSKVLVKAYLPTLDEKRGVSLDDIESLRWIPSRHRKTFSKPVSVSRSTKRGVGQTVPWEIDVLENEGKPLPGLLDPNKPGQINPKVDISGTWVGPSNVHTLANPDYAFGLSDQATLLGITETPHWYRSGDEGAKTYAGEGFQYGGFDKDSFVEIPIPKYADPKSIGLAAFNSFAPPFYQRELPQEMMDFVNQFPQPKGSETLDAWRQKVGDPLSLQQLIDQGHLMPLSENQKILNSPFIQTGEPMDIAMRLLKLELAPPMTQGVEEQVPMQEDIPMVETMDYNNCDCAEKIKNIAIQNEIRNIRNGKGREDMLEWLISSSCEDIQQQQFYEEAARMYCGFSETDQMKYTGEPMDIAFQLLKEELSRVASSPTITRQKRIVADKNPANLPCPSCGNKILQEPCQRCGRPASLGAGTLKSDISKNLNRWFKEKWVDVSRKDKDGKHPPCGRSKASKSSKGYPKCRPSVKVSSKTPKTSGSMSEGQKRAATKRKRSKKQGVGGKPTIVKVE